jgi:SPP1 family predicted phage head-tail adaptor
MNLDRRITIQTVSESQSATGAVTQTWSTYASRRASVEFRIIGSDEDYQAGQKRGFQAAIFHVRHDNLTRNITPKMRIQYEGDTYEIRSVSENTDRYRRMWVRIEAEILDVS